MRTSAFLATAMGLLTFGNNPAYAQVKGSGGQTLVTVTNLSDWDIHYLYMSPSTDSAWGPDRLGSEIIRTSMSFNLQAACNTYDIKLIDEDQDECVMSSVNICGASHSLVFDNTRLLACQSQTASSGSSGGGSSSGTMTLGTAAGGGGGSSINFVNQTLWTITYLHMSSTSQNSWGPDRLGSSVISPGTSFRISGLPCDSYDLKLIDEDSDVCIVNNMRVCGNDNSLVLTNQELLSCQN